MDFFGVGNTLDDLRIRVGVALVAGNAELSVKVVAPARHFARRQHGAAEKMSARDVCRQCYPGDFPGRTRRGGTVIFRARTRRCSPELPVCV